MTHKDLVGIAILVIGVAMYAVEGIFWILFFGVANTFLFYASFMVDDN